MDIYTAFLIGVLVGQWLLLFAIWRALVKLVFLLDALEGNRSESNQSHMPQDILLLDERRRPENEPDIY